MEAISDGSYLAPLMEFGEMVSSQAPTYMYVYSHTNHHHDKDKKVRGALHSSDNTMVTFFTCQKTWYI